MNFTRTQTWMIVTMLAATLAGLAACRSTQSAEAEGSDAWITTKVTAKLTVDPELNPFEIDVDTDDRTVLLSGMVETEQQRQEAAKLARDTEGVRNVVNQIRIGDPTLRENIDDAWISTKVKSKLAADPQINKLNIDVDVLQGVVTLSGIVKKASAREHAEEIARRTTGVTDVKNLIEVAD